MNYQRKFVIKLNSTDSTEAYVKDIFKNTIGVFYEITYKIKNAKIWRYKKTCENSINILETRLDPTKPKLKKYTFISIEITDNQTLRSIKLNKINKNEFQNR
jgi:hypothetical protein